MSNVIKAYSVCYKDEARKTIDSHLRLEKELDRKRISFLKSSEPQQGFVEGLNAVVVEELPSAEDTSEKTTKIMEDAHNEAQAIIDKAKQEAEQIKNDAYNNAFRKGYEEGLQKSKREADQLAADYEKKVKKLDKDYETMMLSMEPQMAGIIAALVEKLTGIMVEDKKEIILYLIDKSIRNMDKSEEYTIRVSKDDFEYVSAGKDVILAAISRDVPLSVVEDATLTKNQCLIETDTHVIDCSLNVQLGNLITDLRLLGGV